MTSPGRTGYSPLTIWTSVPQIVVVVTRITASPAPACGRGTSSTRMSPGPWKTVARIVPTVLICVLLVQSAWASSRAGQDPRRTGGPPGYLAWLGLHPLDEVRYQSSCGDPWADSYTHLRAHETRQD